MFIVALSRQSVMREGYARVHMQFLKAGLWYFAQIPMLPSSKCWMRIGIPEETAVMHNRVRCSRTALAPKQRIPCCLQSRKRSWPESQNAVILAERYAD